jgi:hypothetical protein
MSIIIVEYSIRNCYEERRWDEIRKEVRVEREEFTAHITLKGAALPAAGSEIAIPGVAAYYLILWAH